MSGTMRCSRHGINYPLNYNMCVVPGCEERLSKFTNDEPDPDFKEMVAYHTHLDHDNEVANFTSEDGDIEFTFEGDGGYGDLLIPDVEAELAQHADMLWIAHEKLIDAGYRYLEDFGVVQISGRYYELQAHIGRASLSHGIRGGVWWVEEIDPDVPCPDYPPEEVPDEAS